MEWTDRSVTLGLILTLSLGIGTLFLLTASFVLAGLFEFLGLITIGLGWFVLAPAYYLLTRPTAETGRSAPSDDGDRFEADDPVEILQRRYAAGELSEDEFERRLNQLLETDARASDDASDAFENRFDRDLEYE